MQDIFFIAEACDNHLGDLDKAIRMCEMAKEAGANAVKFQHHLPDEEMLPDIPMSSNFDKPLYDFLKQNSLSLDEHKKLNSVCRDIDIEYMCTPFSWRAAEEINPLVKRFKIGSGELRDLPFITRVAQLNKPMIMSTGMCDLIEIHHTYNAIKGLVKDLTFLNCTSEYPPVLEDMNLGFIKTLKAEFPNCSVGHSDHTQLIETSLLAVAFGAKTIEKHVTLDPTINCPDKDVSITFEKFGQLVDQIQNLLPTLNSNKKINQREEQIRSWAYRSIVTTQDINKGETLSLDNIWTKRPGTGIPAYKFNEYIGKKARVDIFSNTLLREDQLE